MAVCEEGGPRGLRGGVANVRGVRGEDRRAPQGRLGERLRSGTKGLAKGSTTSATPAKEQQQKVMDESTPKEKKEKGEKSPLEAVFAKAMAVKKLHQSTTSQARVVLDNIKGCNEWIWASGGIDERSLAEGLQGLADGGSFAKCFLAMDPKTVHMQYDNDVLHKECVAFSMFMEPKLKELARRLNKVVRMHSEHLKDN